MAISTLTSKGQMTLPKPIRDYLGLELGDKVEFIINEEGQVVISPKTLDVEDICGMFKFKKGVSIDDMNQAITHYVQGRNKPNARH